MKSPIFLVIHSIDKQVYRILCLTKCLHKTNFMLFKIIYLCSYGTTQSDFLNFASEASLLKSTYQMSYSSVLPYSTQDENDARLAEFDFCSSKEDLTFQLSIQSQVAQVIYIYIIYTFYSQKILMSTWNLIPYNCRRRINKWSTNKSEKMQH